jgi:hypothetical protein
MPIRDIDGILNYLEKEADDELAYLEATGAEYFTSAQLLRLRGQWEIKNQLFREFQKVLLWLVAVSPVWLGGWFLFRTLQLTYLALLSLALFPLSFVLFFAGLIFMFRFFRGKGHLDRVGEMIDAELQSRIRQGRL